MTSDSEEADDDTSEYRWVPGWDDEDPDDAWTSEHGAYRARSVHPIKTVHLPEDDIT